MPRMGSASAALVRIRVGTEYRGAMGYDQLLIHRTHLADPESVDRI